MTLNQILTELETIANNHKQINTYGYGDIWDIATSGDINYPLMWVSLDGTEIAERRETVKFKIIFMDIVKGGQVNEQEVLSDQLEIAKDVVAQLSHPNYEWSFLGNGVVLEDFTERFTDSVSGWTASIALELPFSKDRCAIPYVGNTYANEVCPVVTIYNSTGGIITTVNAGGSYTVVSGGGAGGTINVYLDGTLVDTRTSTDLNAETVNITWI